MLRIIYALGAEDFRGNVYEDTIPLKYEQYCEINGEPFDDSDVPNSIQKFLEQFYQQRYSRYY